ncbi:ferrichrome transport ATP-binding protein FhuC [Lachnospiraceae bacterium KM106-2]|nr:ferrichrome transport ATP-binding protein FhuC [Lachnospiraceae bacterium KM106-2]
MIKVKNLSFSYGKKKILHDLSFEIERGTITTILGQNGCGKSTLLQLLTKNLKPDSGSILVEDKEIKSISLRSFARLASVVNQYNTVPEALTVEQLVAYGRLPYFCTKESANDAEYIEQALKATSLYESREVLISSLSGGQMQRVWIAMAIAQNAKILFLDEPTTYLDVHHQVELMRLIQSLKEEYELTVVMILHDINQAVYYSDKIIGLKEGRIAYNGDTKEFVSSDRLKQIYGIDLRIMKEEDNRWVMAV